MLSRRDLLKLTCGGAAAACGQPSAAAASQPATPVHFAVPPGACDCHTHVFGDRRQFPFADERSYTPETATIAEMRRLHRALHMARVVIVQPSVYGIDNACTLDAIRALGSGARGVAVIDERTRDAELDDMNRGGVRGVRINLSSFGERDPGAARRRLDATVARVRDRGWHIQMYTDLVMIEALKDWLAASPVPIVFDHFGGARGEAGPAQPGFDTLLGLVRDGRAYVKISAAYRSSSRRPEYGDVTPLAKALVAANRARILWGSDWPHPDSSRVAGRAPTDIAPLLQIDDGRLLNQLVVWAPDAADRTAILVDNPSRLYGF